MLLQLILLRLGPLAVLRLCKDRRVIKKGFVWLMLIYGGLFVYAGWKILVQTGWKGIVLVPLSMLPHYLCYGFAAWLLARCIWNAWSDRVWKRIFGLSFIGTALGVFAENYWNPKILQFFFDLFKNFFEFT